MRLPYLRCNHFQFWCCNKYAPFDMLDIKKTVAWSIDGRKKKPNTIHIEIHFIGLANFDAMTKQHFYSVATDFKKTETNKSKSLCKWPFLFSALKLNAQKENIITFRILLISFAILFFPCVHFDKWPNNSLPQKRGGNEWKLADTLLFTGISVHAILSSCFVLDRMHRIWFFLQRLWHF